MARLRSAALVPVALAIAILYAGCGGPPSTSEICDKSCSCMTSGCTAKDKQQCESGVDQLRMQADAAGCSSEFDDLLSCAEGDSCKNGALDVGPCQTSVDALTKCLQDNQP